MSVNVKLGGNTISGVSSVKLESADAVGTYEEFYLGGTHPTLYAPVIGDVSVTSFNVYRYQIEDDDNGKFSDYYDLYKSESGTQTLIATIPSNKIVNVTTKLSDSDIDFPVGEYYLLAYAKADNFNTSSVSNIKSIHCYSISKTLSHCSETTGRTKFCSDLQFDLTFTADNGYALPDSIQITYLDETYSPHVTRTATLNNGVLTALNSHNDTSNGFRALYQKTGTLSFYQGYYITNITIIATATQAQLATVNITCDFEWTGHDDDTSITVTLSDDSTIDFDTNYGDYEDNHLYKDGVQVTKPYQVQNVKKISMNKGWLTGSVTGGVSSGEFVPANGETITLHVTGD